MKKKLVAMVLSMALVASFTACGKSDKEKTEESVNVETNTTVSAVETAEEGNDSDTSDNISADGYITSIDDYIAELSMMVGSDFTVNCGFNEETGLYPSLDAEGGIIFAVRPDYVDNAVTVAFGGSENEVYFNSVRYKDHDIENCGSLTLDNFMNLSDTCKILFTTLELNDGCQAIMVEERGQAYSFADGITYRIYIVKIEKDGSLNLICDTSLEGSGDEDITEQMRNDFNNALNTSYSQDYFEDMFYEGNMYIEKENKEAFATITFKSYPSEFADKEDWDSVNDYNDKIYNLGEDETVYWGEGHLTTK